MTTLVEALPNHYRIEGGDVGIEIEVEAEDMFPATPNGWRAVREGSLRGHALEYVSRRPVPFDQVGRHVRDVMVPLAASRPKESSRTSVHAHINCQNLTPTQIYTFATLYWLMENPLTEYCGPDRVSNLFCLRLLDAQGVLDYCIRDVERCDLFMRFNAETLKYAGLNVAALARFGTLEFRAMRGLTTAEPIIEWIETLKTLKEFSLTFKSPDDVLDSYFASDREAFIRSATGPAFKSLNHKTMISEVDKNLEILLKFAYCTDWSKYEASITKKYGKKKYATDSYEQARAQLRREAAREAIRGEARWVDNVTVTAAEPIDLELG